MIGDIFEAVTEAVTGMFGSLSNVITSTTSLIYDSQAGNLTAFGTLCVIGVGAGLVWFGFRLIKNLIRMRG